MPDRLARAGDIPAPRLGPLAIHLGNDGATPRMDEKYTGWIAAAVLLIGALVKAAIDLTGSRAARDTQTRKDTLDEYRDLLARLRTDLSAVQDDLRQTRDDHSTCERRLERMSERIGHYEEALSAAGIKFRAWVDPDGSATHPIRPGGQP